MEKQPVNPMIEDDSEPAVVAEAGGKKRRKAAPRDSAFKVEGVNRAILEFTDKGMYVTTDQIAALLGVSRTEAAGHMNRLHGLGLLGRKHHLGYPLVFFNLQPAKDLIDSDTSPVSERSGSAFARHAILTGTTILSLCRGEGAVAKQINAATKFVPTLDDFITEAEIVKALGAKRANAVAKVERKNSDDGGYPTAKGWQVDDLLAKEAIQGRKNLGRWRDEWLCTIFAGEQSYHTPDLVLEVPNGQGGKPRFVAFEIERSRKPQSVRSILDAYLTNLDQGRTGVEKKGPADVRHFELVVWVCADQKVQALVDDLADEVFAGNPLRRNMKTFLEKDLRGWIGEAGAAARQEHDRAIAERREARARGMVHLLADGSIKPCNCSARGCTAKYGRFANVNAARDRADELR